MIDLPLEDSAARIRETDALRSVAINSAAAVWSTFPPPTLFQFYLLPVCNNVEPSPKFLNSEFSQKESLYESRKCLVGSKNANHYC